MAAESRHPAQGTAAEAWQRFEASMIRRALSAGTVRHRRYVFTAWLCHVGAGWRSATTADVEGFLDAWAAASPGRRRDVIQHLSAFYRWAVANEVVVRDPCLALDRPRVPPGLPRPARNDELARAIAGAAGEMRLMLVLMAACGLRCCEVAALTWADVDLDGQVIVVRGKGRKVRRVALPPIVLRELAACDDVEGLVVMRTSRAKRRPDQVSDRVNRYLSRAGVRSTAHQLRHRAAVDVLEASGSTEVVQAFLGHASLATTQVYARVSEQVVHRAVAGVRHRWAWEVGDPAQMTLGGLA